MDFFFPKELEKGPGAGGLGAGGPDSLALKVAGYRLQTHIGGSIDEAASVRETGWALARLDFSSVDNSWETSKQNRA